MSNYSLPAENIIFNSTNFLHKITFVLLGVVVLTFASQLSIPIQPVPLTFQSAAVILIGMLYGSRYSAYVICCYYLAAILGLPVLAGWNTGMVHFFGPTGGYLLGFLPAAIITGYLMENGFAKNFWLSIATAFIGAAIIFACGIGVLSAFVGVHHAIQFGLMPFIISEPIKLLVIAPLISKVWKHK